MTKISKLLRHVKPSRQLPLTSPRRFQFVWKKGNALSKDRRFTRKHLAAQAKTSTKKKELPAKRTTMMSDLPRELAEDVIIRLPMTSMRAVRSVCKEWNTLSKDSFFTKKHIAQAKAAAAEEFKVVMVMDFKVYLTNLNLHGIHKGVDPTISRQGKLISLDDSNQVDISRVYHCDGLVLCITKDLTRLVVWNPYWGQTLWVKPGRLHQSPNMYKYAIGYENSKSGRSYKILRHAESKSLVEYSIYELNSNSWRDVVDVTCDLYIHFYARGVSLKGNTYWFGVVKYQERISVEIHGFLICFDFTRERFGPRLRLPFLPYQEDTVTLSSVREEQLAVLFQRWDSLQMEIWVTVKIEPEVVLWNKVFLRVDMEPLTGFQFGVTEGSFFIDQDKKVAVVFDKDKDKDNDEVKTTPRRNTAYIIGEGGYFREVDLEETSEIHDCPLGCSYVPNSMLIKQRGKRKKNLIIY